MGNAKTRFMGSVALGLLVGPLFSVVDALAQDATDTTETVVVTGRRTVDTSPAEIKRTSSGIVDSISMTQIDQTADFTLPEALDRIAGVSSDTFYGTSDAGYATVRGFDSRYNSMDIDGNPILFSSQNNRGAQIGLLPSAIVKEVSIYKAVTSDQDGNSIGGHISLRTLRAFDGGTAPYLKLNGSVGAYEQDSRINDGPSARLSGIGKFTFGNDNQYGFVAGFSLQRLRSLDNYGGEDGYTQTDGEDYANGNLYNDSTYDKDVENLALFAKLEMRRSDKLYAFLSATFIDEQRVQYLQRTATYIYASKTTNYDNGTADFTGGQGQTKEYDYTIRRQAKVIGAGIDYRIADDQVVSVRANYTDYSNDILTRYPDAFILKSLSGSYDLNGDLPTVTQSDTDKYEDAGNWAFRNTSYSYNRNQTLLDDIYSLRADYAYNTHADAEGFGFSVGGSWVRLDRDYDENRNNYKLPSGSTLYLSDIVDDGVTMKNNAAVKTNWNAFWQYMYENGVLTVDGYETSDYVLTENIVAAYGSAQYSWNGWFASVGMRYEHTGEAVDTSDTVSSVITPVSRSGGYDNLMPNLQVRYQVTDDVRVHLAITKTIGRPDFSDYAPGRTDSYDSNGVPVISGTNFDLGPREATNYDISLEYYLSDGIVSLGVFHKDIDHETFSQISYVYDDDGALTLTQTVPLNTGAAHVTGVEFGFAKDRFDFLPAPFDRLGLNANFSYLSGTWDVVFTDGSTRSVGGLRNQPRWMGNLTVSYDWKPFDFSLAYRVRGKTFTGTFGTTSVGDRWVEGYDLLNFTAGVTLSKGLKLSLQARNLTDSYVKTVTGLNESVYNSIGQGRSYFLNISYRL